MKKFSVNDMVKVKLTDVGKDIFYHQFDDLNEMYNEVMIKPRYPEVDDEGFTKFQLWHLMNIYGPHLRLGGDAPFEDCAIYISCGDLEEVSLTPTWDSLSNDDKRLLRHILWNWCIDKETLAVIYLTYEKDLAATRTVAKREAFCKVNMRKE